MLSAILPIRIAQNPFWNSSTGLGCIKHFLETCGCVSAIDQFIVVTEDDQVRELAQQQYMEISKTAIPGSIDWPYTFEQTRSLARNFKTLLSNRNDALLIADHRNLFLTAEDIVRANSVCQQNPGNGVISLAYCQDYPCQYRSYFKFLGCLIIQFDKPGKKEEIADRLRIDSRIEMNCLTSSAAEIRTRLIAEGEGCRICFNSNNFPEESLIAQILPFDQNGPRYEECQETIIKTPHDDKWLEIDTCQLTGLILIFTMPAQSGEYDTIELFTPKNASWELGESASIVYSKMTHEPLHSRQQFPPTYTYDGTLSILCRQHFSEKETSEPIHLILKNSCIVTDWVDYWHTFTARQNREGLEV